MSICWEYAERTDEQITQKLQDELGVPKIIAHLLSLRSIDSFDKAKNFFRGDINGLHDPFLMKDMNKAAGRLAAAVRNDEKILIYGDYDVDGTTATSIMYLFLKNFGVDINYYIPHRFDEGYGLNGAAVKKAIADNVDLMITVDCGITAVNEAQIARQEGVDLIVCDHHNVGNELPDATAILNPKQADCSYPFEGLSGAGVAFKLVQAATDKLGLSSEIPFQYLDLVAVSTASDIVPVVDENRILMREGLQKINSTPRAGLKALLNIIGKKPGHINTSNIVFSIGPRINAAGRMGDAKQAVKLLIADNEAEAKSRAHDLESINLKRRDTDKHATEQAHQKIETAVKLDETSAIVLADEKWHLGVIGIVASRLIETYRRPTILLSEVDGMLKGSARSIEGFNIYDAISECDHLLEEFGGHEFAAGLSLKPENLEPFKTKLNQTVAQTLNEEDRQATLQIDCRLSLGDINRQFWKLLSQFKPFGPENMRPVFVCDNVNVVGVPAIVGDGHLKMKVRQNGSGVFDTIGFNMHEYLPQVRSAEEGAMKIAYNLEENYWRGKTSLQLKLLDIQFEK